jgi:hypothetical protein
MCQASPTILKVYDHRCQNSAALVSTADNRGWLLPCSGSCVGLAHWASTTKTAGAPLTLALTRTVHAVCTCCMIAQVQVAGTYCPWCTTGERVRYRERTTVCGFQLTDAGANAGHARLAQVAMVLRSRSAPCPRRSTEMRCTSESSSSLAWPQLAAQGWRLQRSRGHSCQTACLAGFSG